MGDDLREGNGKGQERGRWGAIKTKSNDVRMLEGNPLHCVLQNKSLKMHVDCYTLSVHNLVRAPSYQKIMQDLIVLTNPIVQMRKLKVRA